MRRLGGGLARVLLVLIATVAAAWAGFDPAGWAPDPADPRSYEQVKVRFADALAVTDYPTVFRELQADAAEEAWRTGSSAHGRLLQAFGLLNERFGHFNAYLD